MATKIVLFNHRGGVSKTTTSYNLLQLRLDVSFTRKKRPAEVNTAVQYGAGVRALIMMLSVDCKMPLEQISQLFADILGYNLNSTCRVYKRSVIHPKFLKTTYAAQFSNGA